MGPSAVTDHDFGSDAMNTFVKNRTELSDPLPVDRLLDRNLSLTNSGPATQSTVPALPVSFSSLGHHFFDQTDYACRAGGSDALAIYEPTATQIEPLTPTGIRYFSLPSHADQSLMVICVVLENHHLSPFSAPALADQQPPAIGALPPAWLSDLVFPPPRIPADVSSESAVGDEIGQLLRLKDIAALTNAQMAKLLQVNRGAVQKWLNGSRAMKRSRRERLNQILDSISELPLPSTPAPELLRQALFRPSIASGKTPVDYLIAEDYSTATGLLAISLKKHVDQRDSLKRRIGESLPLLDRNENLEDLNPMASTD